MNIYYVGKRILMYIFQINEQFQFGRSHFIEDYKLFIAKYKCQNFRLLTAPSAFFLYDLRKTARRRQENGVGPTYKTRSVLVKFERLSNGT